MSLRVKLTLLISALLTLSLSLISLVVYKQQEKGMISSIRTDAMKTSDAVLAYLTPDESTPNMLNVMDTLFDETVRQLLESVSEPDEKKLEQISTGSPDLLFEIINILDKDGNLLFSPVQRNSQALDLGIDLSSAQGQDILWKEVEVNNYPFLVLMRPVKLCGQVILYVQVAKPLRSMRTYLDNLSSTLIRISLIEIVLSTLVVWFVLGITLARVKRMTETADSIREEQDFAKRVVYSGPEDEIGQLACSFNEMLENIQESYARLKESLQQQRNFVADVSHELRTPLTTINGNLSLLRSGKVADEKDRSEILQDMSDETTRLMKLVNELLELARADISDGNLSPELFKLRDLTEECRRQMAVVYPERTFTFKVPEEIELTTDRTKLKQLLIILLDNACKHSEREILVEAESLDETKEIRVINNGEGISAADLPKIFDRFRKGQNSHSGMGLGLAIAKALTISLGGTITAESIPNEQTTFTVRLKDL